MPDLQSFLPNNQKKVEFLELIYDLMFVYMIGKNNVLLLHVEDGFFTPEVFLGYLLGTFIILNIWYYTTIFINLFGTNGIADHIAIFVNMYLLFYMAEGTHIIWEKYYVQYNGAWGLILVNMAIQHFLKMRTFQDAEVKRFLHRSARMLLIQALIIFISIPVYLMTGKALANYSLLFAFAAMIAESRRGSAKAYDFAHLSERVMLFVVCTFGEMLTGISSYFQSGFTLMGIYYSAMTFLIVVGLLLVYGYYYNEMLNRDLEVRNNCYMLVHVMLIFSLNNITTANDFMRYGYVGKIPKMAFLSGSLIMYFICLYLLGFYTHKGGLPDLKHLRNLLLLGASYTVILFLTGGNVFVSAPLTAAYIFFVFLLIVRVRKKEMPGVETQP